MKRQTQLAGVLLLLLAACGGGKSLSDSDFESEITGDTFQLLKTRLRALNQAALDLQNAAPAPPDRGWDDTIDANAVVMMKNSWKAMRTAWEGGEGVITPLFPALDDAMDSRYEDMLPPLPKDGSAPQGDTNPFDGSGVIGMHAVERILYAPDTPDSVITREALLPGSNPAVWPATADEAATFKTGLCARLVMDSQTLLDEWKPQAIDLSGAFQGLTGLMSAQQEKVTLAAQHEEESRYSQRTMGDLRDNLAGTTAIYSLFMDWLSTKANGLAISAEVEQALDMLGTIYSGVDGDAIPSPPSTWDSVTPSMEDQHTPFGLLYGSVLQAVDPNRPGSVVDAMNHAARALGLPQFMSP